MEHQRLNWAYIVDSNVDMHGRLFNGIPVYDPKILNNEHEGEIFVYIASMHFLEMHLQLASLGLRYKENYY
jgi:hypothetical protein